MLRIDILGTIPDIRGGICHSLTKARIDAQKQLFAFSPTGFTIGVCYLAG
jgi:hypothetical protein